jgi:hypothetical protein
MLLFGGINLLQVEAKQALLQNNSKDVRLSKNKVSQKCKTLNGKVLSIKDKFEGFDQKKRGRPSVERKKKG